MGIARKFYKKLIQRPLRGAIFGLFRLVEWLMRGAGLTTSRWFAEAIGYATGKILFYERRVALHHLEQVFSDRSKSDHQATCDQMFRHFGLSAAELLNIEEALNLTTVKGIDLLQKAASDNGAIVIGGHLGNWELLGAAVASAGVPLTVIARRIYDPRFDQWMRDWRSQFGIETVVRDAPDAAKKMLLALRNKRVIVMLIDQDTDVPSVWANFMGKSAKTPSGPARMALRGAPVFLASIRRKDQGKHLGQIQKFEDLPDSIEAITEMFNQELTTRILENPGQWVWMHRRWKSKAPAIEP